MITFKNQLTLTVGNEQSFSMNNINVDNGCTLTVTQNTNTNCVITVNEGGTALIDQNSKVESININGGTVNIKGTVTTVTVSKGILNIYSTAKISSIKVSSSASENSYSIVKL